MATIKTNRQKISACLWFNDNAEKAVRFYTSLFKNSKKGKISYYGKDMPMPKGTVLTISFKIEGQEFLALNGGPSFKFTGAISFIVSCKNQKEIDYYWEELSKGGLKEECGWLKDKFGISWQIVPIVLNEMVTDKNMERSSRVMKSILTMKKIDIKTLTRAYKGERDHYMSKKGVYLDHP
jgi:predicted 3-demethylubiquinone-9 3-methyltransferase (glyoxalase superfamily)